MGQPPLVCHGHYDGVRTAGVRTYNLTRGRVGAYFDIMTQNPQGNFIIRPLAESDSLEELTELLHRAYAFLAGMGLRFYATFQDVETTRHRVSTGHCFVAELDSKVIGTITYYEPSERTGCEYYRRQGVCHLGQLAVDPELQQQGVAGRLMRHAEEYARSRGMSEVALDTAEPATHLISWYERMGYRFISYHQWDITNYRSVLMAKALVQSGIGGDK